MAYGLDGVISFSRITRSDHFPADVFFSGAMGYVISRCAVKLNDTTDTRLVKSSKGALRITLSLFGVK